MFFQENLYDLLFEISNEDRHKILLMLQSEPANLTQLSKKSGLNLPETRRHVSRLMEVNLIERNPDGSYSLTLFGARILEQVEEISFFTHYKNYFLTHPMDTIPREYRVRLRDLSDSEFHDNILSFIRGIEQVIREARTEVWLLVDQFPLNHLSSILEALERGVRFRILEPRNRMINPDLEALAPEESQALTRMKVTPLVEQKMLDEVNLFMYVSEKDCAVAFPTLNGEFDYKGFKSKDETPLEWCRALYQSYWDKAMERTDAAPIALTPEELIYRVAGEADRVVITGRERPEFDAQALQDAVDNYDEVILKGRFNLGTSTIIIKRNVVLRGEGRTNNIPDAKIYKKGWNFPFSSQEFLFLVRGDKIDVTIENIHVENFNGTCIGTSQGNSVNIRKNRITLLSGLGRGLSFGKWGDHVVGITVGGEVQKGGFPGGIVIEENYLDFASSYERGGFITHDDREREPDYRPNLLNHEAPICVGLNIVRNLGKVIVRNNVVRNMNSRGILVCDNWDTSDIKIHDNTITSEVFGAYPYNSPMAGVAIFIQSAWSEPRSGGRVEVVNNKIICDKVNYCGIAVHGPSVYQEGVGKLEKCIIKNNDIDLEEGLYGIQIRKSDHTEIVNNKISGKVYYGLQINGGRDRDGIDLSCNDNIFADNIMKNLLIKPPDGYSDSRIDGYNFTGSVNKSVTAHVWMNSQSRDNVVKIKTDETVDLSRYCVFEFLAGFLVFICLL